MKRASAPSRGEGREDRAGQPDRDRGRKGIRDELVLMRPAAREGERVRKALEPRAFANGRSPGLSRMENVSWVAEFFQDSRGKAV